MSDIVFLIPLVAVPSAAAVIIAFSPLGKALAARRRGGEPDPALLQKMEEQESRLLLAEDEIEKLRERLEFTERLLAAPADTPPAIAESGADTQS